MSVEGRNTRQREAIRTAFEQAGRPLTPEEVWGAAHDRVEGLSLATVYRNLRMLMSEQWLSVVDLPGNNRRYEISGKAHHHHFQCTSCSKVFELAGCGVTIRHKLPAGFTSSGHEFTLYGRCDKCSPAKAGKKAAAARA